MESTCSPDNRAAAPSVPLKTYQWEDLRRARETGAYPWTHLQKPSLVGDITAKDILRESTPRRSMSRDRSRTRSPCSVTVDPSPRMMSNDGSRSRTRSPDEQRILLLDASPGSCRKLGEEGEPGGGIHVPNFSKEVSLDSDEYQIDKAIDRYIRSETDVRDEAEAERLHVVAEKSKSVSPKGILKRQLPDRSQVNRTSTASSGSGSKCCHPIVEKIKYIADKTLHKHDKEQASKEPSGKKKKATTEQEILHLKSSPRIERKKFAFLKMGESDEVSETQNLQPSPINPKRKDHIYEDIEQSGSKRFLQFASDTLDLNSDAEKDTNEHEKLEETPERIENVSKTENKSNASKDPSLQIDEDAEELRAEEHIMESLHQHSEYVREEAIILDTDDDTDGTGNINRSEMLEEVDQSSPNIIISEITEEVISTSEAGYYPEVAVSDAVPAGGEVGHKIWSAPNSDHEYELIGKPPESTATTPQMTTDDDKIETADDELSSITSLERKYLQQSSDDEGHVEQLSDEVGDRDFSAEALQKTIEDRYFLNTPTTTASRTECDISTSQVESSALENLPLKRDSRVKCSDNGEGNKIQQSIRAQTVKLKSQAGKLRTKLQSMKNKRFSKSDKPRFHMPDRPKFHMPERPKFNFAEKTRFSLPDRKKFTLPERPKFKKINISFPDKNRFTLPDRPKFPDMPRFKIPDKAKINFSSLGRAKKDTKHDANQNLKVDSTGEYNTRGKVFDSTTFPRIMSRTKKQKIAELASSDPALNRPSTPPPTFSFVTTASPKSVELQHQRWSDNENEEPRSYGQHVLRYEADADVDASETDDCNHSNRNDDEQSQLLHRNLGSNMIITDNKSLPNISGNESLYTHVDEINTDEFFIRPKGISRENIEMRKYLSDEIREAFKAPANALAQLDTTRTAPEEESVCGSRTHTMDYGSSHSTNIIKDTQPTSETYIESDDGYYTFPPVRPSRAKKTKKKAEQAIAYIDNSSYTVQYDEYINPEEDDPSLEDYNVEMEQNQVLADSMGGGVEESAVTVPSAPLRRKRSQGTLRSARGSLDDFYQRSNSNIVRQWNERKDDHDGIIVYRTEHEYTMPETTRDAHVSPVPPRRSRHRSRDSRTTSLGDDDRTSHGAESLILDPNMPAEELRDYPDVKRESPGYATVEKCPPPRSVPRSRSRTPPVKPRKSHSNERKYYTADRITHLPSRDGFSNGMPSRPRRKKSSTSLVTLESLHRASSGDVTQYVEIDDNDEDYNRKLQCGDIINKMKDRPLPPPPRPPRSERKNKSSRKVKRDSNSYNDVSTPITVKDDKVVTDSQEVIEIEVSTQTDPLPDDIDFELGMEECFDEHNNTNSVCSSLKDIIDADVFYSNNKYDKTSEVGLLDTSRPTSRTSKGAKDPKIRELTRSPTGRISPTVILVERRVSSPTRINNRDEIVTEASLTVQHIEVDESKFPDVPLLPQSNTNWQNQETVNKSDSENKVIEKRTDERSPEVQLDSLVTQRLQVTDLDVGRLNVAELQAGKILVSEIEGLTLQISELDSKSGHITVSGVQLAPQIIEEIVRKFAEISARTSGTSPAADPNAMPASHVEETPIEAVQELKAGSDDRQDGGPIERVTEKELTHTPPPSSISSEPPQRPPPPDLSPLLLSYLQELSLPPASFYHLRSPRERPFTDYYETRPPAPPPPARRAKRKTQISRDSSSDEERGHGHPQAARRGPSRGHEPTLTELSAQFWRVCHTSVTRTVRHLFTSLVSYVSGCEDKKDVQMAVVIFLVLIAGLIMFGLSDGRTVHHHHWEFFNPPDGK